MSAAKVEMDIEMLLRWAYRDELSKRAVSAAEGIWDRIQDNQHHGGIDRTHHGAGQRYAHFGLPDPDAERIERAVTTLDEQIIDWPQSIDAIAGDLGGLITINDVAPSTAPKRVPRAGWGKAGDRALKGMFGPGAERPTRPGGHACDQRDATGLARRAAAAQAYPSRSRHPRQDRR
jgi:hypothetical protein